MMIELRRLIDANLNNKFKPKRLRKENMNYLQNDKSIINIVKKEYEDFCFNYDIEENALLKKNNLRLNVEKELDFVTKEYFNIIFEGNINNIYTDYKIDSYMIPSDSLDYKSGDIRLLSVDNKVHLPVNKEIKVLITSADVLHS